MLSLLFSHVYNIIGNQLVRNFGKVICRLPAPGVIQSRVKEGGCEAERQQINNHPLTQGEPVCILTDLWTGLAWKSLSHQRQVGAIGYFPQKFDIGNVDYQTAVKAERMHLKGHKQTKLEKTETVIWQKPRYKAEKRYTASKWERCAWRTCGNSWVINSKHKSGDLQTPAPKGQETKQSLSSRLERGATRSLASR